MNQRSGHDLTDTLLIAGAVLFAFTGVLYAAGGIASLLTTGEWVTTPWIDALRAPLNPGNPGAAFGMTPAQLPPTVYWVTVAVVLGVPLGAVYAGLQVWQHRKAGTASRARVVAARPGLATRGEIEVAVGRRQVIRRGRSARPQAPTASPSEVGTLLGHARGRECWASVEDSRIDVGPPRSGKGLHQIIAAIIDAPGAVVTTSTRPDNLAATLERRRTIGPVAVFDPQALGRTEGIRWSPVRGCENPTTAIVRASGLAAGAGFAKGNVSDAAFWHGQTEMALRGLLHAAALDDTGIAQLYRWSLEPASAIEAVTILNRDTDAAEGWGDTLDGIVRMDSRTRDAIWAGVRSALSALADPAVRTAFDPPPDQGLDPASFIQQRGTIYLLGTGAGASATSAFIAALLEDITESARQIAAHNPGGRLEPPLALVLDEIANLCAVPSLPGLMADGGGTGISTHVVIQSLAQARERWGEQAAAAMWDAATLRLILGGSAQPRDLQDLAAVCGERDEEIRNWSRDPNGGRTTTTSTRRLPILPPDVIRTLPFGTGILLARTAPPILLNMTPWPDRPDADAIRLSIARATIHP
ncbi:type IV secretory system conjugative DNA transfer family protein [Kribbella sandramycini]|uniref:Type IV secretory pathway TraG/TraD family ATPase VirD4 n=1 Tax=Kribbella sandramycini TaxID=60450 RepID=A0A7Y4L1L6_9ACTN|nr:TraM recognition domain-containing protein [Kribbella sandramycini]MBB6566664.1 type IV secretory pathway TraG/TraD family ATPase VirD4 [Kribbella sandramycini]NOL42684.1 type IV secretory system conjugative DNA transfer family protein [Kribbella sandramycini]